MKVLLILTIFLVLGACDNVEKKVATNLESTVKPAAPEAEKAVEEALAPSGFLILFKKIDDNVLKIQLSDGNGEDKVPFEGQLIPPRTVDKYLKSFCDSIVKSPDDFFAGFSLKLSDSKTAIIFKKPNELGAVNQVYICVFDTEKGRVSEPLLIGERIASGGAGMELSSEIKISDNKLNLKIKDTSFAPIDEKLEKFKETTVVETYELSDKGLKKISSKKSEKTVK